MGPVQSESTKDIKLDGSRHGLLSKWTVIRLKIINSIFQNKMTIEADKLQNMIVTEPDIEWGFTCKYETDYTVQGDAVVSSAALDHQFGSDNGQFSFDFKFYETESFDVEQTDAAYKVGQQINFGREYIITKYQSIYMKHNFSHYE